MAIVPLRSEKLLVATALSTGVALLCAMTHASAQQTADDGSSTLLDTIVVPAGKRARLGAEDARALREADFRASSSVRTVTREEIKQIGPSRPDNILQTVPGVFTQGQARMPGVSVNVRGMQDFGRTNVSVDGARQTFQYTTAGPMGMAFIDPALIRGVSIAKGTVVTEGGAGSLGGIVNFRTLELDDILTGGKNWGAEATTTYGTNGYNWSGTLAAGARNDRISGIGALSFRDSGRYRDGNGNHADQTGQDLVSGLAKVGLQLSDEQTLDLGFIRYHNEFALNSTEFDANVTTLTAKHRYDPDSDLVDLRTNAYYNKTKVNQYWFTGNLIAGEDIDYNNDSFGFDVSNVSRFSAGGVALALKYGMEGTWDRVRTEETGPDTHQTSSGWTPSGNRSIVSGFAEMTATKGMFDLTAAARIDHFSLSGSGNNPTTGTGGMPAVPAGPFSVDKSETAVSPKVTLAARPAPWLSVYGSYGLGFRPPAITETLMANRHPGFVGNFVRFYPNPFLEPERSKGWEAGANLVFDNVLRAGDGLRLKGSYYSSEIDDYIVSMQGSCVAATCFYFDNVAGTSKVKGFELDAAYDAGFAFAGLGYHHIKADLPVPSAGLGVFAGPPKQVWTLTAGVRLFEDRLTLGGRVRSVSESVYGGQASTGTLPSGVEPYRLYDAFASYKVSDNLDLNFTAENLTDKVYKPGMTADSMNGPGRTLKFSIAARF
ncbi:TonB-dependent receptor [Aquamicrobium sp.]|uniref:TonB-dependent receptor domain-containing protein n=1 Tax=Aquamicrobium sp. TaxID=1872579 RepID=UPI00258F1D67|nr:TonB-dependent receptor [Aquamicrobium sp.]MCK9549701.1 TonB-dependent receptor [Aquamicrobium sp.]